MTDEHTSLEETIASALDQVKYLLAKNWESDSSYQGPEHDPSPNKQLGALDPTKLFSVMTFPKKDR